ncbi:MAG: sodium:solute symporter family transporter [Verrucomicrobiales bacterium]
MDPLIYSYAVGGSIFAVGLFFAAKQGYLGFRGRGLLHLLACVGVIGFFFALQAYLQYAPMDSAPPVPYKGGAEHVTGADADGSVRGTALDYGIMIGYFVIILGIGTWFGRRQKTTKDFFFGGQRFSWWLIGFSLIATTVGSYSFVKYSNKGFGYGLSSSQTYLNDWIWFPLLIFGWLPILYFSRVTSAPEYLGRRFNSKVRLWATVCILIYLVGYIGVNLFTMGKVLNALIGWPVPMAALLVAMISATYVTAGGQTSVIMTDLFQGVMLLLTGGLILFLGIDYIGGFGIFWENLPRGHRTAFPNFNEDPSFPSAGIFWQDGIANTAMFYLLNQGIIMRFLAAKSLSESRKAATSMMVVLMVVAACVVGGGGWVAAALVNHGDLPADLKAGDAFYVATEFLSKPGVFGLVLAALTAALMSTVDTLITAVAALTVNDLYKPYIRPEANDRQLMKIARLTSVSVTIIGVILVPVFMIFDSIYEAHGAFTAAVTPPLVVTLLLSVFWRRFTATAAICTIIGGLAAIALSIFIPQLIAPFAHGVPSGEAGDGLLGGMKQYKFMRACYGIAVCGTIGIVVSLLTKPEPRDRQTGLVWGTIKDALKNYKGSEGREAPPTRARALPELVDSEPELRGRAQLPVVHASRALAEVLGAAPGDLVYISDTRSWLGGLRSAQAVLGELVDDAGDFIRIDRETYQAIVTSRRTQHPVVVERLY